MQHFALAVGDMQIGDSQHSKCSLSFAGHDPARKPDATFRDHALVPEIDFDDLGIVLDMLHRAF
jgi:hypothetical protein